MPERADAQRRPDRARQRVHADQPHRRHPGRTGDRRRLAEGRVVRRGHHRQQRDRRRPGAARQEGARPTARRQRAARRTSCATARCVELQTHELVLDDVVELRTGAQVVADGVVLTHENLEIDESLLTGEADPVVKDDGDDVLSGSAVVAGTGRMVVTKVGAENYAAKLAEEARRFTLVNSPLRNDVNRIVKWVGYLIIPVGLLLASSQFLRRDEGWQRSIISTVAGLVGMVPEGLVLLTSVAFAVGVVRLASKRCLVQELPAIEVLARVDVLCVDKTGTITEGTLALADVQPLDGADRATDRRCARRARPTRPRSQRDARGHCRTRTPTRPTWQATGRVPFSSARKWSAMTFGDHGSWVLGAPENVLTVGLRGRPARPGRGARARRTARAGAGHAPTARSRDGADATLPAVTPVALVLLEDIVRHDAPETLKYFADQGVT